MAALACSALVVACGGGGGGGDTSSGGGGGGGTPTALDITLQPISQTVAEGAAADFTVTATGSSLGYQWQASADGGANWSIVAGATTASYHVSTAAWALTPIQVRVQVSGSGSNVMSRAATLTVIPGSTAPALGEQPADQAVLAGADARFTVTATGRAPSYQWSSTTDGSTWAPITGATTAMLTLPAVLLADSGRRVRVAVSNSAGSVTSNSALLTVNPSSAAPAISVQPQPANAVAPLGVGFSVTASGTPALAYQWQISTDGGTVFTDIAGATAASYSLPSTTVADDGKKFRVRLSNTAGQLLSSVVTIRVAAAAVAPSITTQPADQSVTAPAAATFTIAVGGMPTPTLRWQLSTDSGVNYADITGATAATYTTAATTVADSGKRYRVLVSNSAGTATSNVALLTVAAAPTPPAGGVTAGVLAAGATHTCGLRVDRSVVCWGDNTYGALGLATPAFSATPLAVPGLSSIQAVASGASAYHTCAIRADATVACWGAGSFGQLGNGSSVDSQATPTAVTGLTGATALALGFAHACAVRSDGRVLCWGNNSLGQLGDGSNVNTLVPVQVLNISNAVAITAGNFHSCALLATGSVSCWGDNTNAAIGDGSGVNAASPVAVPGLAGVVSLGAGYTHNCVARSSGAVLCWGQNDEGQIGDGSTLNRPMATAVPGISATFVSAGWAHSCARASSGAVFCWGRNASGQLGDGTTTSSASPVAAPGAGSVVIVQGGAAHACAVRSSGTVSCWGHNDYGQVGTTINSANPPVPTPVDVSGLVLLH